MYLVAAVAIIAVMCIASFGVIRTKRCRSTNTWYPENHYSKDYPPEMIPGAPPAKRHRPIGREDNHRSSSGTDSNDNEAIEATRLEDFGPAAFRVSVMCKI